MLYWYCKVPYILGQFFLLKSIIIWDEEIIIEAIFNGCWLVLCRHNSNVSC